MFHDPASIEVVKNLILAICGLIVAIGGACVYVKKLVDAIKKPIREVNEKIEEVTKNQKTNESYFKNDAKRLDEHDLLLHEIQEDNKQMLSAIILLMSHAETGNNTGEIAEGRKKLEKYLIDR